MKSFELSIISIIALLNQKNIYSFLNIDLLSIRGVKIKFMENKGSVVIIQEMI